jgi:hypothetical protein
MFGLSFSICVIWPAVPAEGTDVEPRRAGKAGDIAAPLAARAAGVMGAAMREGAAAAIGQDDGRGIVLVGHDAVDRLCRPSGGAEGEAGDQEGSSDRLHDDARHVRLLVFKAPLSDRCEEKTTTVVRNGV